MRFLRLTSFISVLFIINTTYATNHLHPKIIASDTLYGSHNIQFSDTNGDFVQLAFGVNSTASYCLDPLLGEFELPPFPPNFGFSVRFVNQKNDPFNCLGLGSLVDYHPYINQNQVDTFTLKYQPPQKGFPVTISWDSLSSEYAGPVILTDILGGQIFNVNMKTQTSATLDDMGLTEFLIIASEPIYHPPPLPSVATEAATNIGLTRATLHGTVVTNGVQQTKVYFQYGEYGPIWNSTPVQYLTDSDEPQSISAIAYIRPDRVYKFQICAQNISGIVTGTMLSFTTDHAPDPDTVKNSIGIVTGSTGQLNGIIGSIKDIPTDSYFEWGETNSYGNSTPVVHLTGDDSPAQITTILRGLKFLTTYHFRAVKRNVLGVKFGDDQTFGTAGSDFSDISLNSYQVGHDSVKLIFSFYLSDTLMPVRARFAWGPKSSPDHFSEVFNLRSSYSSKYLALPIGGLKPGIDYGFRMILEDSLEIVQTYVQGFSTPALATIPDSTLFRIPIEISNNNGETDELIFGLSPGASYCIDPGMLEIENPPPPPEPSFYCQFIDSRGSSGSCLGDGINVNIHGYFSDTQIDTFLISFSPSGNDFPMAFSWPDLHRFYSGPVTMTDLFKGIITDVDMLSQTSYILTNEDITKLRIIAMGPKFVPASSPLILNTRADSVTASSAIIHSTMYSNGLQYYTFIEWGLTDDYGNRSEQITVNTDDPHDLSILVSGLPQASTIHYRLVVMNEHNSFPGTDHELITTFNVPITDVQIPLVVSALSTASDTIRFGVHPYATNAIDYNLGEMELPPAPSLGFDVRLISPRNDFPLLYGNGLNLDLRHFNYSTQVDTYRIAIQMPVGSSTVSLTWPDLNPYYSGPVVLQYRNGSEFPTQIDMLGQHSTELAVTSRGNLTIIARGPRLLFHPQYRSESATWHFDHGRDSIVLDSSPNHNNGNCSGTTIIDGEYGAAMHFNGNGSHMLVPNDASLNFNSMTSFSINLMFRTTMSGTGFILQKGPDSYSLGITSGHIEGCLGNDGSAGSHSPKIKITSQSTYNDGAWHDAIFSRVKSTGKIFLRVDNTLCELVDDIDTMSLSDNQPLVIGESSAPGGESLSYTGDLDEINISSGEEVVLTEIATIPKTPAITDVPNDQGKQVTVSWIGSILEKDTKNPVTHYTIWREDSTWTMVKDVSASGDSMYHVVAPTLIDSTIKNGNHLSTFEITAQSSNPLIHYSSDIVAGYSKDNVAPHIPAHVTLAPDTTGFILRWNNSTDQDFDHFNIYRGILYPPPAQFINYQRMFSTTGSFISDTFIVHGKNYSYYVTSVDSSGNESLHSMSVNTSTTHPGNPGKPLIYAVHQNYPNPFNPTTNIQIDLPLPAMVTLTIYNILGQEITTLINTEIKAGYLTLPWNAGNYSSGIYPYRITIIPDDRNMPMYSKSFRMILVK